MGERIRKLRKEKGLTLKDVSGRIAVTSSMLSSVEMGCRNPSLGTLRKLARVFEVPIFHFLMSEAEHPGKGLVRKEDRKRLQLPNNNLTYELLTPDFKGKMEVVLTRIPPGEASSAEPMTHAGEEWNYVVQGDVELTVGDTTYTLEEGDSYYHHAEVPHRIHNPAEAQAVVITAITPPRF